MSTSRSRTGQVNALYVRKFCRLTPGVGVLDYSLRDQSLSSASIERLSDCRCLSETCKYKKCIRNGVHDDFLLNCNNGCKKHIADRAGYHRDFNNRFRRKVLRANDGFHPK